MPLNSQAAPDQGQTTNLDDAQLLGQHGRAMGTPSDNLERTRRALETRVARTATRDAATPSPAAHARVAVNPT